MADIPGTPGDDFLFGTDEDDEILGLAGNDFLLGLGGNDLLDGGDDNDTLAGGGGSDLLLGGNGDDSLAGDDESFGVFGEDTLTGGLGADAFTWSVGSGAQLSTSVIQDVITDFEGAGAAGGDTLELVLPFGEPHRLTFRGALPTLPAIGAALAFGNNDFTDVFYAFDGGATILFADSDDDGVFDAEDFSVRILGNHTLVQSDFGDTEFVTAGTNGHDNITGTDESDTIFVLGGNDTVSGGLGNDTVNGGNGNDTLNGEAGNDVLRGDAGNDDLRGGDGIDRITGGAGSDTIDGGAGRDTVLAGGDGNDVVFGGAGNDTLDGDAGNDQLFGGTDNDDLFGGDGNDLLFGEDGDDFVEGLDGDDQMFGGLGNDEFIGDAGADTQTGGAGDDEFVFFMGSFNPSSPFSGPDRIVDFEGAGVAGGDEISLREQVVFHGEQSLNPKLGAALPGGGNSLTDMLYTIRSGTTWLIADDNDDGVLDNADFAVKFDGAHQFSPDDFPDTTFLIAGTNGDDVLVGTNESDVMFGLAGNDQMFGVDTELGGTDELHGGLGDDTLDSGLGFANLFGEDGNDTLSMQNSIFGGTADGGAGNDLLIGSDSLSALTDLRGGAGDDTMIAGEGGASMADFEGGNDRMVGSAAEDQFFGGDGVDQFVFGAVWNTPPDGFRDIIFDLEDGVERIDLSGSGLEFGDLTIDNSGFSAIITSSAGQIEVDGFGAQGPAGPITQDDFLF
jgi:Ca2+-binding RTX toxin-like protein